MVGDEGQRPTFSKLPKLLHKNQIFRPFRQFFSGLKALKDKINISSLVYMVSTVILANKLNFDPKILAYKAQSYVYYVGGRGLAKEIESKSD